MRKVLCDGCGRELRENYYGFILPPNVVFFEGTYHNGKEIMWCKDCTLIAEEAVRNGSHA